MRFELRQEAQDCADKCRLLISATGAITADTPAAFRTFVNNRDLQTLTTSLDPSLRLLPQIPPGPLTVSESGLASGADVEAVVAAGAHAVLVGETLLRAVDVAGKVRELSLR